VEASTTTLFEQDPVDKLIRLKAENEYPLFPSPIYCSPELWEDCIAAPGRDQQLQEAERTDSILTSMAAAIDRALGTHRADFARISFKHWYWDKRPKARKKAQVRLDAYLRYFPNTNKPWLLVTHKDWLPETLH